MLARLAEPAEAKESSLLDNWSPHGEGAGRHWRSNAHAALHGALRPGASAWS
jgi:hypothetical protein